MDDDIDTCPVREVPYGDVLLALHPLGSLVNSFAFAPCFTVDLCLLSFDLSRSCSSPTRVRKWGEMAKDD
jgi:hypothetical protein